MNKETIYNQYATKHGHEGWWELLHYCMKNGNLQYHINAVTDLIQEELKKKIAKIEDVYVEDFDEFGDAYVVIGTDKKSILNTEIL